MNAIPPGHLFLYDTYEPEVMAAVRNFVRPGDCAIDVGAGIGFFSAMLGKIVGPDGLVLAFEPDTPSFRHLVRNVHLVEKLNNVACLKMALWKSDCDELKLYSMNMLGYTSVHDLYHNAFNSESVPGRKLDTLLTEGNHPRFLKIDAEGAEWEVLLGAENTLRRGVDCVIVELNYSIMDSSGRDKAIRWAMHELGYQMFLISIADGNGGFLYPIRVEPRTSIDVRNNAEENARMINVMFSTEEKVREVWPC